MPSIQCIGHPNTLALQIAYSFAHLHVRSSLLASIKWLTNCAQVSHSSLHYKYSQDSNLCDRNDDMNGNCDGSFWLKDCRKYEMFLAYFNKYLLNIVSFLD